MVEPRFDSVNLTPPKDFFHKGMTDKAVMAYVAGLPTVNDPVEGEPDDEELPELESDSSGEEEEVSGLTLTLTLMFLLGGR